MAERVQRIGFSGTYNDAGAEADATWLVDKGGYEAAFTGINATLRDYARLGMLLGGPRCAIAMCNASIAS